MSSKRKQKPFQVSVFKKYYEKFSFALTKYSSSRFVFRCFGSLVCARRSRSFCPTPSRAKRREISSSYFRIHRFQKPPPTDVGVVFWKNGGGEIRTRGALRHSGFQDRCTKPLCDSSISTGNIPQTTDNVHRIAKRRNDVILCL